MSYPLFAETYNIHGRQYRKSPYCSNEVEAVVEQFEDTPDLYNGENDILLDRCDVETEFSKKKSEKNLNKNEDIICSEDPRITIIGGRKWKATIDIPNSFMGKFLGHNRRSAKMLEESTSCRLKTPRRDEQKPVEVSSIVSMECVQRCLDRIELFLDDARKSSKVTHFCGLPCNDEEVKEAFDMFKESIMNGPQFHESCLREILFTKAERLHLTLAVLRVFDEKDELKLKNDFQRIGQKVRDFLKGDKLIADIQGVDIMNDDPCDVSVLYAKIRGDTLQKVANMVRDELVDCGFSNEDNNDVKLHMTLMNGRYLAQADGLTKYSFDASEILKEFESYYFGTIIIDKIVVCPLNSDKSKNEFYPILTSVKLEGAE